MTQLSDLREHFAKPGAKLTAYAAANDLGIARLSPRIGELEREGYQFLHQMVSAPSRRGSARVAEYVLTTLPKSAPEPIKQEQAAMFAEGV